MQWLTKKNNNCYDRAYTFVMLCLLRPYQLAPFNPRWVDDISRTSQCKCQWRNQQSRFVSISHHSGWAQCTVRLVNCVKIGILCRAVSVGDCRGSVLGRADHPPGTPEYGSAWQNSRELAVASLGGPCSGTHRELREAQRGQLLEDLGTWSRPSVQVRQLYKGKMWSEKSGSISSSS